MEKLITILIVILIIFTLWNIINVRSFKKILSNNENRLADDKYFELKYKIEFLIAAFSGIVIVVGYLGYGSLDNAENELKKNMQDSLKVFEISLKEKQDSIEKIGSQLNNFNLIQSVFFKEQSKFSKTQFDLRTDLSKQENRISTGKNEIDSLDKKIKTINSKNILNQNFYLIDNVKFNMAEEDKVDLTNTFYFKDLSTSLGDKLPEFKKPPIVFVAASINVRFIVTEITTEYVKLYMSENYIPIDNLTSFNMVVIVSN